MRLKKFGALLLASVLILQLASTSAGVVLAVGDSPQQQNIELKTLAAPVEAVDSLLLTANAVDRNSALPIQFKLTLDRDFLQQKLDGYYSLSTPSSISDKALTPENELSSDYYQPITFRVKLDGVEFSKTPNLFNDGIIRTNEGVIIGRYTLSVDPSDGSLTYEGVLNNSVYYSQPELITSEIMPFVANRTLVGATPQLTQTVAGATVTLQARKIMDEPLGRGITDTLLDEFNTNRIDLTSYWTSDNATVVNSAVAGNPFEKLLLEAENTNSKLTFDVDIIFNMSYFEWILEEYWEGNQDAGIDDLPSLDVDFSLDISQIDIDFKGAEFLKADFKMSNGTAIGEIIFNKPGADGKIGVKIDFDEDYIYGAVLNDPGFNWATGINAFATFECEFDFDGETITDPVIDGDDASKEVSIEWSVIKGTTPPVSSGNYSITKTAIGTLNTAISPSTIDVTSPYVSYAITLKGDDLRDCYLVDMLPGTGTVNGLNMTGFDYTITFGSGSPEQEGSVDWGVTETGFGMGADGYLFLKPNTDAAYNPYTGVPAPGALTPANDYVSGDYYGTMFMLTPATLAGLAGSNDTPITKITLTVKTMMNEAAYIAMMKGNTDIQVKNSAFMYYKNASNTIKDLGDTATTHIKMEYFSKKSEKIGGGDPLWTLKGNTYFILGNNDIFIVDKIEDRSVHNYDESKPLTIKSTDSAGGEINASVGLISGSTQPDTYDSLDTLDKVQNLWAALGGSSSNATSAIVYDVENSTESIMIIKLGSAFANKPFEITYTTKLGTGTPFEKLQNVAKIFVEPNKFAGGPVPGGTWPEPIGSVDKDGNFDNAIASKSFASDISLYGFKNIAWYIDVNDFGGDLTDVTITDKYDNTKLRPVIVGNSGYDGRFDLRTLTSNTDSFGGIYLQLQSSVAGSTTVKRPIYYKTLDEIGAGLPDKDYFALDEASGELIFHFAALAANQKYKILVVTEIVDISVLVSSNLTNLQKNSVSYTGYMNGMEVPAGGNDIYRDVLKSTLISKSTSSPFTNGATRWGTTINTSYVKIQDAVITDLLPREMYFDKLVGIQIRTDPTQVGGVVGNTTANASTYTFKDADIEYNNDGTVLYKIPSSYTSSYAKSLTGLALKTQVLYTSVDYKGVSGIDKDAFTISVVNADGTTGAVLDRYMTVYYESKLKTKFLEEVDMTTKWNGVDNSAPTNFTYLDGVVGAYNFETGLYDYKEANKIDPNYNPNHPTAIGVTEWFQKYKNDTKITKASAMVTPPVFPAAKTGTYKATVNNVQTFQGTVVHYNTVDWSLLINAEGDKTIKEVVDIVSPEPHTDYFNLNYETMKVYEAAVKLSMGATQPVITKGDLIWDYNTYKNSDGTLSPDDVFTKIDEEGFTFVPPKKDIPYILEYTAFIITDEEIVAEQVINKYTVYYNDGRSEQGGEGHLTNGTTLKLNAGANMSFNPGFTVVKAKADGIGGFTANSYLPVDSPSNGDRMNGIEFTLEGYKITGAGLEYVDWDTIASTNTQTTKGKTNASSPIDAHTAGAAYFPVLKNHVYKLTETNLGDFNTYGLNTTPRYIVARTDNEVFPATIIGDDGKEYPLEVIEQNVRKVFYSEEDGIKPANVSYNGWVNSQHAIESGRYNSTFVVYNSPLYNLKLKKVNDSGGELTGAKFSLTKYTDGSYDGKDDTFEAQTKSTDVAFTNIPYGFYELTEVQTPQGYVPIAPYRFEVDSTNTSDVDRSIRLVADGVIIANENGIINKRPTPIKMTLQKVDSQDNTIALTDYEFTATINGITKTFDAVNNSFEFMPSDYNFNEQDQGWTITLKETKTPYNYSQQLDSEYLLDVVKDNDTGALSFVDKDDLLLKVWANGTIAFNWNAVIGNVRDNIPIKSFSLRKVNAADHSIFLSGFEFKVYFADILGNANLQRPVMNGSGDPIVITSNSSSTLKLDDYFSKSVGGSWNIVLVETGAPSQNSGLDYSKNLNKQFKATLTKTIDGSIVISSVDANVTQGIYDGIAGIMVGNVGQGIVYPPINPTEPSPTDTTTPPPTDTTTTPPTDTTTLPPTDTTTLPPTDTTTPPLMSPSAPLPPTYTYSENDDGTFTVFDENGIPLGYINVPEGKMLEDMTLDDLIPFGAVIPKDNPKTSDSYVPKTFECFIMVIFMCGLCISIQQFWGKKQKIKQDMN